MSHEIICGWLGLPTDVWPPDHYRLLGLDQGEGDVSLIEQRVHQRLDSVRPYQMIHPEQATEAMNRLAQAFVCLTEPATKKAYDQSLRGERPRAIPPPPVLAAGLGSVAQAPPMMQGAQVQVVPPPLPAAAAPRDPLMWLYTPAVAGPGGSEKGAAVHEVPPPPVRVKPPSVPVIIPPPLPAEIPAPPPPPAESGQTLQVDTVVEAAQASPQARRGLATKRALYRRVGRTRRLLRLWQRLGKHLTDAEKRLNKQEAGDLFKLVKEIEEALEDFPLLGEAGQPGYLIVALTQLDKARALQGLATSQRESLSRDWKAGKKFLEAHRDYLREELRANRNRGWGERMIRAARAYINEQPLAAALLLLALAAVAVVLWRSGAP